MQGDRIVKTISFDGADLDRIGAEILAPDGPRAIRVRESRSGGRTVVFVAHHEDATRVLMDEDPFSLGHYAKAVGAIAPGIRFLMAPQSSDLKHQREVFYSAAKRMGHRAIADAIEDGAGDADRPAVARTVVGDLLDCFRARAEPEFDIICEYAYFAPYLVGRKVFGLGGPVRPGFLVGLVGLARRLFGSAHRFTPETTPFLTAVYLAQFAFAQVFMNFENRNRLLGWIAARGGAAFSSHIGARLDLALTGYDPFPKSLLSRLSEDVRSGKASRAEAVSLLVEMFGTILLIPASAFTGIVAWMVKQNGGIPAVLEDLNQSNARGFVDELLRLNPPSRHLLRTAVDHTTFGSVDVQAGDYVCALVAQACRDPKVFVNPDAFDPGRPVAGVLHFGPMNGPHQCLGRELARDMIAEMLLGLRTLTDLEPADDTEMKSILGFPQLRVRWRRPKKLERGYGPHRSSHVEVPSYG